MSCTLSNYTVVSIRVPTGIMPVDRVKLFFKSYQVLIGLTSFLPRRELDQPVAAEVFVSVLKLGLQFVFEVGVLCSIGCFENYDFGTSTVLDPEILHVYRCNLDL